MQKIKIGYRLKPKAKGRRHSKTNKIELEEITYIKFVIHITLVTSTNYITTAILITKELK